MDGGSSAAPLIQEKSALIGDALPRHESASAAALDGLGNAYDRLAACSKSRRAARRKWHQWTGDVSAAVRLGALCTILTMPFIIWPLGEIIETRAISSFLSQWSTVLMLVVFNVGADLGTTVKYTSQGLVGTTIAWVNIAMLDYVLYVWLGGGAYNQRSGDAQSSWLPLCHVQKTTLTKQSCFLNIAYSDLTLQGCFKASFMLLDFVVGTAWCLAYVPETNTRAWALFTHLYFCMSFLDPTSDGSSLPKDYMILVLVAAACSPLCLLVPKPRLALRKAERLSEECVEIFGQVLENLPRTPNELLNRKAIAAFQEGEHILAELEAATAMAWYEGFDFGARRKRRRYLLLVAQNIREAVRHVPLALQTASSLAPADEVQLGTIRSLQNSFRLANKALFEMASIRSSLAADDVRLQQLWQQQPQTSPTHCSIESLLQQVRLVAPRDLSSSANAFVFVMCEVLKDCDRAVTLQADISWDTDDGLGVSLCRFCNDLVAHFGDFFGKRQGERNQHCVIRNTLSIGVAFLLGWIGFLNVLRQYDTTPCNTICFILVSYAGASIDTSMKRISGVVTGKVVGASIQMAFAVQEWDMALCYAVLMWSSISFTFFVYLHSERHSYAAFLCAAYTASSIIPVGGFRQPVVRGPVQNHKIEFLQSVQATTMLAGITDAVFGCVLMVAIDAMFAPKASDEAKRCLHGCFGQVQAQANAVFSFKDFGTHNLDGELKQLRKLISHASSEPTAWRPAFKRDLFLSFEKSLTTLASQLSTVQWAQPTESLEQLFSHLRDELPARLEGLWRLVDLDLTALASGYAEQRVAHPELRSALSLAHMLGAVGEGARGAMDQVAKSTVWARRATATVRSTARRFSPGGLCSRESTSFCMNPENPLENLTTSSSSPVVSPCVRLDRDDVQMDFQRSDLQFDDLIHGLRQDARYGEDESALQDASGRLDLVIYLVKAMLFELHRMQMPLLDV